MLRSATGRKQTSPIRAAPTQSLAGKPITYLAPLSPLGTILEPTFNPLNHAGTAYVATVYLDLPANVRVESQGLAGCSRDVIR